MIRFEIKPEIVEWLVQDWVREPEMAQELIEGLMGMMIAYGCISAGDDGRLKQATAALLVACEMAIEAATVYDTDEFTPGQIAIRQAAKEAGMLPNEYVMQVVRAAVAEVREQAD